MLLRFSWQAAQRAAPNLQSPRRLAWNGTPSAECPMDRSGCAMTRSARRAKPRPAFVASHNISRMGGRNPRELSGPRFYAGERCSSAARSTAPRIGSSARHERVATPSFAWRSGVTKPSHETMCAARIGYVLSFALSARHVKPRLPCRLPCRLQCRLPCRWPWPRPSRCRWPSRSPRPCRKP